MVANDPWPWYVAGPLIAFVMFALIYFGKTFGVSSNFRAVCSMVGAGRCADFFKFDWRANKWNFVFLIGAVIGGIISSQLSEDKSIPIAGDTRKELAELGIDSEAGSYLPGNLFSIEALSDPSTLLILVIGGALVGFGARYAGGCTSGHAITGLSNLQWPSLLAVIGFFIGGLAMVHLLFPVIFG